MKLSELNPNQFTLVQQSRGDEALKLSSLNPDAVTVVQASRGIQTYDKPVGPEQESAIDRFSERIQDPARWKAVLTGEGPYARKDVVQGTPPLMLPGGAIPKLTKAATALATGKGLGFSAARTALSTGQGALMAAADGKEGESWQDKIDRAKSGAKLSGGIQLAAESIPVIGKVAGYATKKISHAISGVDESLIQNYAARTDEVNDLIKQSGGDITEAADQVRAELSAGIQSTKQKLNAQISQALQSADPESKIPIQPVIESLKKAKAALNPNFKAGAMSDIDDMISSISQEAVNGSVSLSSLYQIKQFLNENSASAYNKGGQIFVRAGEAARAAKAAAHEARTMLKPVSGAIAEADSQLSKLHAIERRLNKNLLAPGKPDAALLAAGSGANARNSATLRELERLSGVPASQRAQDLATAKVFAKPSLLPTDYTGKALARQAGAAILGTVIGGPVGGLVGGAIASPAAVKLGVNALNTVRAATSRLPNVARSIRENPVTSTAATQLTAGQIRRANEPNPEKKQPLLMDNAPKTGPEKWARDGIEKLGIQDPKLATQILQSKKGKQLLIEASDLPNGSKRLERIMEEIQKGWVTDATRTDDSPEVSGRKRRPASRR